MRLGTLGFCAAIASACLVASCVSKAKADARARAAFIAGQQQAAQQMLLRGPVVTIVGEVRNGVIPWTVDLTLAKAVLAAEYYGTSDPAQIIIVRNGEELLVDPKNLLNGEDIPLQPRDTIELKQ